MDHTEIKPVNERKCHVSDVRRVLSEIHSRFPITEAGHKNYAF